jgi:hypothetical protein
MAVVSTAVVSAVVISNVIETANVVAATIIIPAVTVRGIRMRGIVTIGRARTRLVSTCRIMAGVAIRLIMAMLRVLRFGREKPVIAVVIDRPSRMRQIHRRVMIGLAIAIKVGMLR